MRVSQPSVPRKASLNQVYVEGARCYLPDGTELAYECDDEPAIANDDDDDGTDDDGDDDDDDDDDGGGCAMEEEPTRTSTKALQEA